MESDSLLIAYFEEESFSTPNVDIVINEIMYHSYNGSFSDDWIEIYNNGDGIDLSDWWICDNDTAHKFKIPADTYLDENDYLVLTRNINQFKTVNPGISNSIGSFGEGDNGFGLSGSGECVKLFDQNNTLIDIVCYDDDLPWPTLADGIGPSIQLENSNSDNSFAGNWKASLSPYYTPGKENVITFETSLPSFNHSVSSYCIRDILVYPNPVKDMGNLSFILDQPSHITISIYNLLGKQIKTIKSEFLPDGEYTFQWNGCDISPGIYFMLIKTKTEIQSFKIVK